ncbi:MAG: hypothetical protein KH334_07270, partial [Clostridiales bacterium]|nr:hypothetical protein [Clostridiales bacterium]
MSTSDGKCENFVNGGQKQGLPKYYKVRAYQMVNGSKSYGAFSQVQQIGTPLAPKVRFFLTRERDGQFQHVLNWEAISGAAGYEIYRADSADGAFALVAQNADGNWENYVCAERDDVVRYYKVRAYWLQNGEKIYGEFSEVQHNLPAVEFRFGQDRERNGDYQYVLNWVADPQAAGYEVYRAASESGPFTLAMQTSDGGCENYVDGGQTRGVPKYYKVRPYEIVNGSKSYGAFSIVQKIGG